MRLTEVGESTAASGHRLRAARLAPDPATGFDSTASKPRSPAEHDALAEAQAAAELALRGDYPQAMARLDKAESLSPDFALVCQYRANVAYLQGDLVGAIRALERGLALEPDNTLFRINLMRLRKQAEAALPAAGVGARHGEHR
jgi:tetratricopeptide (TPR) repeat protein